MADDSDPNLGYTIKGDADTSAVDRSAEALKELRYQAWLALHGMADDAKEAREGTEGLRGVLGETATELRHLTGSSREGQEVFRGIGAAARGGAAGIGEMIRGLRSLALVATHVMGEGPLGVLLIALGLIGGAFLAMRGHAEGAAEGTEKAGKAAEEAAKRMEAIKKAVDQIFKPLDDEIKKINEHFSELERRIDAANAAAKRMEKADKDLADSAIELAKAREIDAAGGDEKKIEYINKKYAAEKKVSDAQQELNQVGNEGLELATKKDAADQKALETQEAAAEGAKKLAEFQKELADATQKASVATAVAIAAEARAKNPSSAAAFLAPGTPAALALEALSSQAGTSEDIAGLASTRRDSLVKNALEARERVTSATTDQAKLESAAEKATSEATTAALAVEREQLATQKELLAATNKLATAILEKKDVDKATVDTSEPPLEKEEDRETNQENRATTKANAAAEREEKKEANAEARRAAHDAASEAREHRHEANVQLELARKAAHETAGHLKTMNEAMGQVHHAAREAGKTAEKITRQVTNMTLDTAQ